MMIDQLYQPRSQLSVDQRYERKIFFSLAIRNCYLFWKTVFIYNKNNVELLSVPYP